MALTIGANVTSQRAQRQLSKQTEGLSIHYQRLSSGMRINTAADDAAGLAVSSLLQADARIFGQGVRNVNDAISLISITEGALGELGGVVTRIRELSEQSANGTFGSTQRKAIDAEAQELKKEFDRIVATTSFNGINLLDGSSATVAIQVGHSVLELGSGPVGSPSSVGSGTFGTATTYLGHAQRTTSAALEDLNGDGRLDLLYAGYDGADGYLTTRLGTGSGTFGGVVSFREYGDSTAPKIATGDVNNDGRVDAVAVDNIYSPDSAHIYLGAGTGGFSVGSTYTIPGSDAKAVTLGDLNGDGNLDLVTAGSGGGTGRLAVRLGAGNGTFGAATSYSMGGTSAEGLALGDVNGDGILDAVTAGSGGTATIRLGLGDGTFGGMTSYINESGGSSSVTLADINNDTVADLVTAGTNGTNGFATVRIGSGTGTFGAAVSYRMDTTRSYSLAASDINGDGNTDLVTSGTSGGQGSATVRLGNGDGTFRVATSYAAESAESTFVTLGDINGDNVFDLVTAGRTSGNTGEVTVRLGVAAAVNAASVLPPLSLPSFSLATQGGARSAMSVLDTTLDTISSRRGAIGASQSRLQSAARNLWTQRENYIAASSRITDADVAEEGAGLIRQGILQDVGAAILGQANQAPSLAIQLIG